MKIGVVGWYGMSNVGDEAFKPAISRIFDGHEIEYVRPPRQPRDPDVVVLGGGAVVSPFYLNCLTNGKPRYALGVDLAYESEIDLLAGAGFSAVMFRTAENLVSALDFKEQPRLDAPRFAVPPAVSVPCSPTPPPRGESEWEELATLAQTYGFSV